MSMKQENELIDNRTRTNLGEQFEIPQDFKISNNHIDISAVAVTPIFQELFSQFQTNGGTSVFKNVLYETSAQMNNQMLVTYEVNKLNQFRVTLRTTNDNAAEEKDRVHTQDVFFNCKVLNVVKEFLCVPSNCDLTKFEPVPTPATECEDHYQQSQDFINFVFETSKDVSPTQDFIECVREKVEIIEPNPLTMCFYVGFRPENIVPLEVYETKLSERGFVKNAEGVWERRLEEWKESVKAEVDVANYNAIILN